MSRFVKYAIFFLFSFMFITMMPKAEDSCNYKEQQALNKEISNIKTSYEFIDEDPLKYHFRINITNIAEDLKLIITDDYSSQELEIIRENTDNGVYSFETLIATKKVTFTIEIYSIGNSCYNKKMQTKKVVTPRYNPYSTSSWCDNYPEFQYCDKFKDTSNLTYSEFTNKVQNYAINLQKKGSHNVKNSIFYYFKKYLIYIIIGVVIIAIAISVFLFIKKKKDNFE